MRLSFSQLQDIILNNPNNDLVAKHQAYSKKMKMHLYGKGLEKELSIIEGLEKPSLRDLRAKYARSNKALFASIGRPIDKVFSAKGGSVYYNLPDSQDKTAKALAASIRNGLSVKKWLQKYWEPHFKDDPGGLVFIEVDSDNSPDNRNSKPFCYPTYKSSSSIFDYLPSGSGLEYVVFNIDKAEAKSYGLDSDGKYFRVVDDAFDMIVKQESGSVIVINRLSLTNPFGYVPAMLNSDICDPGNENLRLSPFDEVLDLAYEYLLKGSVKLTYDLLLGFPKYWEFADDCSECEGTGMKNAEKCHTCKGTGKRIMSKVSDVKLLTPPGSKDDPMIAPNVAGFVSPPKEFHDIAVSDLDALRAMMEYTMWGRTELPQVATGGTQDATKTATEIISDQQPMIDRLTEISETVERRHKFIIDSLVKVQFGLTNYGGSSVNYGRRYHIEGPDVIWEKYNDARTKGASVSLLDDLYDEYIEAKYGGDPIGLAINQKLKQVEPFVHMTAQQVRGIGVGEADYKAKVYFSEWLMQMDDNLLLITSAEGLKAMLYDYAGEKELAPAQAPQAQPQA